MNRFFIRPKRNILLVTSRPSAWKKTYENLNITSAYTGLDGVFRFSPIFHNCIADTMVELTGYRSKDYCIAEAQTGKKHTPKVTVWHHAWEEKGGKYRMQLVDFEEHKKTCPHAGGCKLWLQNTKRKSKYRACNQMNNYERNGDYSDTSIFYPIANHEIDFSKRDM